MRKWSIDDSAELYNINGWGLNYFSINEKGHVAVTPKTDGPSIDLKELMEELQVRDVEAPVLLRFPDILDNRIEKISNCFQAAAREYGYSAKNFIIYPIKVNQMRPVVEEIVSHGNKFNIGLEAGSKPELHAVLSIDIDDEAMIICNGYKDESDIELALLAQKMGKRIFLVVEKLMELKTIARLAKKMNVKPNIGIRIKLASSGSGKWEESGGDVSKFGVNSSELLDALDILEKNKMADSLQLIHFHIGSQVTNIRRIKTALKEASQFYVELKRMGYNINFVDIGGGLGVDYDGTRSATSNSMNYSIQEYVNDAVSSIVDACEKNELPQPNIITESGRSLTAHHSVLVFEALASTSLPAFDENEDLAEDAHELVKELYDLWENLNQPRLLETWHDALQCREDALNLFNLGLIDLRTRAQVERLFWSVAREVYEMAEATKHAPDELKKIAKMLPDKYFCNFSLFQSLPDSWAIDQIFPIMPISRLNEQPTKSATIQDITCDSDGKINNFISTRNFSYHLPVHELSNKEPYYFGVFLVGAYQEILGDLHNLFGDTNAVHIKVKNGEYVIDKIIEGETVADVLEYVQFTPKRMARTVEVWATTSVKKGIISPEEGREFLSNYRSGLYGYTYFAFDPELMKLHRDCLKWVEEYNRTYFRDYTQGGELLRKFLPNAHPSLVIQAPFWCDFGFNIYGGENGFINYNCTILDTARIYLGKNILIGPNVQLYAPMHPIDYRERATGAEHGEPITIGDDCWIGGGAVICPGVTIGDRCIVAAGAVVTKDVPDDSMVGGSPARIIRKLA